MLASPTGTSPATSVPSVAIEINPPCQSNRASPDTSHFANYSVDNRSTQDFPPPSYSSLYPTNPSATPVGRRVINDSNAQSSARSFAKEGTKAISGSNPASSSDVKIDDNEFDTRMATACLSGNIKEVNELLSIRPAGIHRFQKYSGMSTALHPLHLATIKNNSELINKLCKYPEIDINVRNHAGQTPLMLAAANNNLEAIKVLLNHPGIDIDARNHAGQTPLWISIAKNNVQAVEILLDHGAEIKKHPKKLYESLLYAAIAGDKELYEKIDEQRNPAILELLLNRGANANKTLGSEGITPLQVAAHFGDIKSIDILVKHGADVRKKNNNGATPMHLAAFANNIEVVKRLLQHGATLEEDRGAIDGAFIFKHQNPWERFEISDLGCLKDRSDEGFKRTAALRFYEAGLGHQGRPLSFLKNEDHGALRAIEQEQIMLRKQQLSKQHNNQSGPTSCRLF